MNILRMTDLPLKGKRVLIREDLNVPMNDAGLLPMTPASAPACPPFAPRWTAVRG